MSTVGSYRWLLAAAQTPGCKVGGRAPLHETKEWKRWLAMCACFSFVNDECRTRWEREMGVGGMGLISK